MAKVDFIVVISEFVFFYIICLLWRLKKLKRLNNEDKWNLFNDLLNIVRKQKGLKIRSKKENPYKNQNKERNA